MDFLYKLKQKNLNLAPVLDQMKNSDFQFNSCNNYLPLCL